MTTIAGVKRLVRPLLDRHGDLFLIGRWIFIKPVHHVACGIIIDRTSDPKKFMPRWTVAHLFEVRNRLSLNWGGYVYGYDSSAEDYWDRSEMEIALDLSAQIERSTLPTLQRLASWDHYLQFVSQHESRHKLFEWQTAKIIVYVALGDLQSAREIWKQKKESWSVDQPHFDAEDRAKYARLRTLGALLDADKRADLIGLLHSWEAQSVKNLKLEKIWEPTPFPLELKQ